MNTVDILIVSDDPLARAGLAALLDDPATAVVGQEGSATVIGSLEAGPDVIVWDAGSHAAPMLERLAALDPTRYPAVVLVATERDALGALAAGARGVLPRTVQASTLRAAVEGVVRGLVVIDPSVASAWPAAWDPHAPVPLEDLTPREHEVLQLMAQGLSNKAIARRLGLSEHTAKFHVNAILSKLDAHSRTEAVTRAARLGLIIL
ncbi:MAG: response regulator transcription factor [Armatimonadota bacterium]|nr:response regulator transcription factor [Armatimonadota bacterium]